MLHPTTSAYQSVSCIKLVHLQNLNQLFILFYFSIHIEGRDWERTAVINVTQNLHPPSHSKGKMGCADNDNGSHKWGTTQMNAKHQRTNGSDNEWRGQQTNTGCKSSNSTGVPCGTDATKQLLESV